MLEKERVKDLVSGSQRNIAKQHLAIAGLLKKIRRNKSLSEDEVAEQAAKAVREHSAAEWSTLIGREGRDRAFIGPDLY